MARTAQGNGRGSPGEGRGGGASANAWIGAGGTVVAAIISALAVIAISRDNPPSSPAPLQTSTQVPKATTTPVRPLSTQPVSVFRRFQTGRDEGQELPAAYCQVTTSEDSSGLLYCWTPNDGFTLGLRLKGTPRRLIGDQGFNRGRTPGSYPRLSFEDSRSGAGFRCTSRRSGLTCRNSQRHGWTLPRYRGLPDYF